MTDVENNLRCTAFDFLPTPTIILSDSNNIVLANRACQNMFEDVAVKIGMHATSLPIKWQHGDEAGFQDFLSHHRASTYHDDSIYANQKPRVRISSTKGSSGLTMLAAQLIMGSFSVQEQTFHTLSFENINYIPAVHDILWGPNFRLAPEVVPERPASITRRVTTSGITSRSQIEKSYARFRDSLYSNDGDDRAGFLLSADERFCYPSCRDVKNVIPVEIDDIELFFEDWDIWDASFSSRLPLAEYPSIWLNRHQTKFKDRRIGLRAAGKDLVLEASGNPLYDSDTGEYVGGVVWLATLGEHADVTAADLRARLSNFRTICDCLPHYLWSVDSDGHADYFSSNFYEFTGLSEVQCLGLGFTTAIQPEDMKQLWTKLDEAAPTHSDIDAEARYRRHDGQWIWMRARAKPMVDSDGNILKWYGSLTDVNDIVIARIEAERQKNQMMEMLSHTDIGLFHATKEGLVKVHEGRMAWLDGYGTHPSWKDIDGQRGKGFSLFKHHVQEILTGRQVIATFEGHFSSRWYKFRLINDSDTDDLRVLGCSVDVTEQRSRAALEAENARLVTETSLEVEKSQLKSKFLAHMSHEIRTPIAGVIATAEILADTKLNEEQADYVNDISISASNLLTILNDILDLSKIEAGQLMLERLPYDLHDLVAQVRKLFVRTAQQKQLQLTSRTMEAVELFGDPNRVTQVLTNLVSNAIKFTSNGSVDISVNIFDASVYVTVEDTGEGIDQQTLATLFQPFVQGDASTARRHGGTGLGLTISRNLAHNMGGSLELSSTLSVGTRAVLKLPIQAKSSQRRSPIIKPGELNERIALRTLSTETAQQYTCGDIERDLREPQTSPDAPKPLVLIVEDNTIMRKIALNLVRKLGYATEAAWNGQEALDFLEKVAADESPPQVEQQHTNRHPAAILMDCQMPCIDGYSATRILRNDEKFVQVRNIPVIALTASAIQGDREKCEAAGMDDYLTKPVSKASLKNMLERWVLRKSPASLS